jgi:hypothetical protein
MLHVSLLARAALHRLAYGFASKPRPFELLVIEAGMRGAPQSYSDALEKQISIISRGIWYEVAVQRWPSRKMHRITNVAFLLPVADRDRIWREGALLHNESPFFSCAFNLGNREFRVNVLCTHGLLSHLEFSKNAASMENGTQHIELTELEFFPDRSDSFASSVDRFEHRSNQ